MATWVIESTTTKDQITRKVATSGITVDAYRGKLLGIYAILSPLSYIEHYNNNFTAGHLHIVCDNLRAGKSLIS